MKQDMLYFINNKILSDANKIQYIIKSEAPSTTKELFNSSSLVIWNGASDTTIFKDPIINYAFRAVHDKAHLITRLPFTIDAEIELARIQASKESSDLMRELIYIEISGQAEYFKKHGHFPKNQIEFTLNQLRKVL